MRPPKTPYLRFGEVDPPLMGHAVEIVGNARALLQLRRRIDRALRNEEDYPLDEALYRDNLEEEYGVVVRKAKSRAEMEPPAPPKPEKTPEEGLPWAEVAREQEAARRKQEQRQHYKEG